MANGISLVLMSNAAAGNGTAAIWPGGKGILMAEATWGGGSAKLQMQTPNGTWIDVDGVSLTANGTKAIDIPAGQIRAVTATASAAYVYAIRTA